MRKLSTGEPYAGELHVRFGGRGGRESFPTPIITDIIAAIDGLRCAPPILRFLNYCFAITRTISSTLLE
jgi:hypothetical protein